MRNCTMYRVRSLDEVQDVFCYLKRRGYAIHPDNVHTRESFGIYTCRYARGEDTWYGSLYRIASGKGRVRVPDRRVGSFMSWESLFEVFDATLKEKLDAYLAQQSSR